MVKPLLLVAIVANLFMLVLCTGQQQPRDIDPPAPCHPQEPHYCRANEIWSECPLAVCAPKTCDDVGFPVPCPDFLPNGKCPVPPGCICQEGFVRNCGGICIPMKHCPSCGGDSNAVSGCGTHCNRMCSNYNKNPPGVCTLECQYNGCDCRPGLVYDEITGKCVFPSQCTLLTCNVKNEIYDPCPAPCPFHTCGIDDSLLDCVAPLPPGHPNCPPPKCRCRDGYYRNDVGQCVRFEDCPVCSGINEMYDPCPAPCPPQDCDVNIALILCAVPPKLGDPECQPGCRCIDNHVRNHAGVCIPRDQCPTCPNINEVYDPCIAPCPSRRCDVDDRLIKCMTPINVANRECVAGCRCADGFYRNDVGTCVTRDECSTCPNINEVYDPCIAPCPPRRCDVDERLIRCAAPPKVGDKECVAGCRCADGYYRNSLGTCVTSDECQPGCNGEHEVFNECIQGDCKPKTCTEVGFPVSCPRIDPNYCIKGCLCEDGYVRYENGECIPKELCPSCGGDCNAVPGCGVHCNNRCSDIGKEPGFCIEICYENACDCKPGYVYDDNTRLCVRPNKCTPTCRANEFYSDCMQNNCNPQNCGQLGYPIDCKEVDPECCTAGCLCNIGFVRNDKGVCVPVKECPSCGGDPNAESGCGKNCGRLCSNYMQTGVVCTLECQINGCNCKKNYVYDSNIKKCVLPKECTPVCKKNEVYSECTNGGCSRKNCSQIGQPVPCVKLDPKSCIKGCLCKEGYLREETGECVPEKECKPKCIKPNEYYEKCDYNCPPNTCESLGRAYACPIREGDKCKGRCKCKPGYYRDRKEQCITEAQCQKCVGPNEFYSCGGACDNVCATLHKQSQTKCPIINIKCNEMCYCDKDYARAKNGTCIPIEDCDQPQCKKNERYEECPAWTCDPQECSDVGFPVACPDIPECPKCPVKPACVCVDGYVKNKDGLCIPVKQCPSCGGDKNAESGCGTNCGKRCEDIGKGPGICPLICRLNGCDCKDGYYFDKVKNKCVLPSECTTQCKKNEVYSKCPAWTCKPKSCCDVGYPVPCPFLPAGSKCPDKPACVCADGYVKNDDGECIPVKQCPSCGGDENAESGCGTNCLKKCEDLGNEPGACPEICGINTCDCKDGYYYDKIKDKCVLPSECTGICSGENEVFDDCTNPVCRPKKCSEVGFPLNCTYVPECNKGCVCKDGYVKNCKGVCIPIKECPSCGGDENAESGCGVNCLKNCYDLQNPDKPRPCPKICRVNACDCKKGYYRDDNFKKCVRSDKCTPTCGKDEVFDPCTNGGCTMKNCTQLGGPMPTKNPKKCIAGCSCKEGYLRSVKGVCIPAEQCAKAKCKKNEKFMLCPSSYCGPRRCDQLGYPIKCPVIKDGCCPGPPGCICEDDYVRNDKGKCIPKRSCPSCGGDKNAWAGCGVNCGKHCDDLNNKTRICPKICIENSCDCKDGFYYSDMERQCVEPSCCTPPCPENEVLDRCVNGGCGYRNCSELSGPILCIDPIRCTAGCTCKKGYLRDDDTGICVPTNKCPPPPCPENEEYNGCVNGGCGYRKCSDLNGPELCIDPIECKGGCSCIEDHVRDDDTGICIPKDKCPKICDKPNEEFVKCPPICPPQTCESINKTYHCPLIKVRINESDCVGECRCIEGFYRNLIGECISEENCLKCTGDHNYFSCGPPCDNVCCDLDEQTKDNCLIKTIKCVERCYCEDGYARDDDENCVPIEDCDITTDPECPDPINSTVAVANFQDGNAKLTIEFLKQYRETRPGKNIMFSTLSLLIALAKLTLGAIRDSLTQLLNLQNFKCKDEIRVAYPIIIKSLSNPQNVTFEIGNKDYADENNCPLTEQYKKDAVEVFFSEAENVDFCQNVEAAETINEWVSGRTKGLITDLVKPEMFSCMTRLAIFNVLYFLGNWKYPFDEKRTKSAKFYLNDEDSVMLPTMNLINRFEYGEIDDLDAKIIVLPYEGGRFKMVIMLPNTKTGLEDMLEKLDVDIIKTSLDSLTLERCNVSIPRMDFNNEFSDLKASLRKVGVTAPFEPNSDDFRGIIENNEPLSITDLIQKTVLKVNEKGTIAVAATGVILTGRSLPRPSTIYNFDANCPFIFLLKSADTIVLSGAFNG